MYQNDKAIETPRQCFPLGGGAQISFAPHAFVGHGNQGQRLAAISEEAGVDCGAIDRQSFQLSGAECVGARLVVRKCLHAATVWLCT